jgi:hypothetical protein
MSENVSLAQRINELLRKVAPKAIDEQNATGKWPIRADRLQDVEGHRRKVQEGRAELGNKSSEDHLSEFEADKRSSPYTIETLPDGNIRVRVTADDGDVSSGVGKTLEDAITALEAKK